METFYGMKKFNYDFTLGLSVEKHFRVQHGNISHLPLMNNAQWVDKLRA
jgi:hypothetical protein